MIEIRYLRELSNAERRNIIHRETLPLQEVLEKVIMPMAQEFQKNPLKALQHYCEKFDKQIPKSLTLHREELKKMYEKVQSENPMVLESFQVALSNIERFHRAQIPENISVNVAGNQLGLKFIPFDTVALYVPGGKALYPSTTMMGLVPAKIAGVQDIWLLSPPVQETGQIADIVGAVAYLSGASHILQAGGAQAILAAAYGVEELGLPASDFLYGPGNIYVAAAKSFALSQNLCGVDSFAGPSEVLILADESANPLYLAQDLLAQAEHDENAAAILLCDSTEIAHATAERLKEILKEREQSSTRARITRESIERNGLILVCEHLDEAVLFSNEYAPEHLEIQTQNSKVLFEKIRAAGSVFIGDYSPVAAGDYYTGTNHILPTNRAARFASGVSVRSFYRRVTWQECSREGLVKGAKAIALMSLAEGLFDEHGHSVLARLSKEELTEIDSILPDRRPTQ